MGSFIFAPTLLFLACNYHGTAGNRRTHSSPCSEGLQSLQPRTGVLAVEGPESSAWRTETRQLYFNPHRSKYTWPYIIGYFAFYPICVLTRSKSLKFFPFTPWNNMTYFRSCRYYAYLCKATIISYEERNLILATY